MLLKYDDNLFLYISIHLSITLSFSSIFILILSSFISSHYVNLNLLIKFWKKKIAYRYNGKTKQNKNPKLRTVLFSAACHLGSEENLYKLSVLSVSYITVAGSQLHSCMKKIAFFPPGCGCFNNHANVQRDSVTKIHSDWSHTATPSPSSTTRKSLLDLPVSILSL